MDKRVHPKLDPRQFDHAVAGFDDVDRDPAFVRARRARQALADAMVRVHDAREALANDATRTPAEQSRLLHDTATEAERRAIQQASDGESALRQRAKRADDAIDSALRVVAPAEAAEIRSYVKSLPSAGARLDFLRQAARDGDTATCAAVLVAKPYLSGLDSKAAANIRSEAERQLSPDEATARDAALKCADEMGAASHTFYAELRKVDDPMKAQKATEQRQRSEQAMRAASGLEPLDDGHGAGDGDTDTEGDQGDSGAAPEAAE